MFIRLPNGNVFDLNCISGLMVHDEILEYESSDGKEHPPGVTVILQFGGLTVTSEIPTADLDAAYRLQKWLIDQGGLPIVDPPSQKNNLPE